MKLVVAPLALAELHDVAAFYTLKADVELGLAFVFRGTRRRYILRRFPYSIIYQVTAEELRILAVAHHRRHPGYWAHRK